MRRRGSSLCRASDFSCLQYACSANHRFSKGQQMQPVQGSASRAPLEPRRCQRDPRTCPAPPWPHPFPPTADVAWLYAAIITGDQGDIPARCVRWTPRIRAAPRRCCRSCWHREPLSQGSPGGSSSAPFWCLFRSSPLRGEQLHPLQTSSSGAPGHFQGGVPPGSPPAGCD